MNNVSSSEVTRQLLYCFLASAYYQPLTNELVTLTHEKLVDNQADAEMLSVLADISTALAQTPAQEDVYFQLFEGLAEPLIPLCSSWYITGSFFELPLLQVRKTLNELGYIRSDNNALSEDHISSLCETMAMLIEDEPLETQAKFYNDHISGWLADFIKRCQTQLSKQKNSEAYAAVLQLLVQFSRSETDLLTPLYQMPKQSAQALGSEN